MGRVFIFTMLCLGTTLVLSGIIIWSSFNEGEEYIYQTEILDVKTAETRENADAGLPPEVKPGSTPDLPVDYTDLTPGLQELVREGKANEEITVDRVR